MKKHTFARITAYILLTLLLVTPACGLPSHSDSTGTSLPAPTPGANTTPVSITSFKLNTIITITLYDSADSTLLSGALALCDKYESLFSRTIRDSEIAKLNAAKGQPVSISPETADLLTTALFYCQKTNGAFDITVAPLTSLWNFSSGNHIVPAPETIAEALTHVGYEKLSISGTIFQNTSENTHANTVQNTTWNTPQSSSLTASLSDPDAGVDLGAIAKGYIADKLKEYLLENGVTSALINLGGNMLAVGQKPDGSPFHIGIQDPFKERGELNMILAIDNLSVVSSGTYERNFTDPETGTFYHHILDPKTGYPYRNSLVQVTILSRSSTTGDALSTSCFALGLEKGLELVNQTKGIHAIFVTEDGTIRYSDAFPKELIQNAP